MCQKIAKNEITQKNTNLIVIIINLVNIAFY